jgi:acetyl-CoA carboxylase biotin carboxylase subunit
VSTYYDSLLAKVSVWAETRDLALARMKRALAEFELSGPITNLEFHSALLQHPSFVQGKYHTGFVDGHRDLLPTHTAAPAEVAAFAVATELEQPPARVPENVPVSRWAASFRP